KWSRFSLKWRASPCHFPLFFAVPALECQRTRLRHWIVEVVAGRADMNALVGVFIALFVFAVLFCLVAVAAVLAAVVFRFMPGFKGRVLAVTSSDVGRWVRAAHTKKAKRKGLKEERHKPVHVLVAINPLGQTEYLTSSKLSYGPVFTQNRSD